MWDLLFSAAGGGVLGLIGTGIKLFAEHKKEAQRLVAEKQLAQIRIDEMAKELELVQFKSSHELELAESTNDAAGLMAAIQAESSIGPVHTWVNDVRGMVRPVLTLMLTIMAFVKPDEEDLVWMASTAVTFWFGDRPRKR